MPANFDTTRILDASPVPAFVIDTRHVVVHWNQALASMSGIPAGDVLGTHHHWRAFYAAHRPVLADIVIDGAPQMLLDKFYRGKCRPVPHCPGGWQSEDFFPAIGPNGTWLAFSANPIRDDDGNIVGCVETLRDVTERKQMEIARREAERKLADIVNGSPIATFAIDADCRVTHWNRACELLTGASAQETVGHGEAWRVFYPYDTRHVLLADLIVRGADAATLAEHYGSHAQASTLVPDALEGEDFFPSFGDAGKWLRFIAAPLHDARGRIVGAIETLTEIPGDRR
ncbi:MAG: PAS domain-containing protein [Rhodocyclaceae bacterium]|nr:PAS domain-containing protein [Rhodocyclaceae bacterium]